MEYVSEALIEFLLDHIPLLYRRVRVIQFQLSTRPELKGLVTLDSILYSQGVSQGGRKWKES